jgi:tetratricopeptide (TPR) repeat protein
VAAGRLIDDDPHAALAHAYAARAHAARIGAVREAVGIAAYLAGEWQIAIAELRAARRMSGTDAHLALLADCERALGRPERALELFRSPEAQRLDTAGRMELLIVAAGARRDLGQDGAALVMLQVPELQTEGAESWLARLRYSYAEALTAAGRDEEARDWFAMSAEADEDGETDAAERVLLLDGFVLGDDFGAEDDEDTVDDAVDEDADDLGDDDDESDGGDDAGGVEGSGDDPQEEPEAQAPERPEPVAEGKTDAVQESQAEVDTPGGGRS